VAYVLVDGLLLGVMAPTEVVGWYGAATRLFTTLGFVAVIVTTASLPRMITAHAESPERMYAAARAPFEWVVLAGLPLGVGLACVAHDLVPLLYGPEYVNAVVPLVILALGLPLTYVNTVAAQMFVAAGRPTMIVWLLSTASVINVGLNVVLIPLAQDRAGNGAIGAAAALVVTEIIQVTMCMAVLGRSLLIRATLVRIGSAALASAVMAGVVILSGAAPLLIQVLLGAITFTVICLLLRLPTSQEIEAAQRIRGRLTAKLGLGRAERGS
jgi:O-antigen/teichoic acid export membrane protein